MQRAFLLLCLFIATLAAAAATAEVDLYDGVVWSDGKAHTADEFKGQSVVLLYFSGECPRAGAFMRDVVKQADALIEEEKAPVRLICVTPDIKPADLAPWIKDHGYVGALVGSDPRNRLTISLKNIMQERMVGPDGKMQSGMWMDQKFVDAVRAICKDPNAGTFRIDVAKPTQAAIAALWWACEREHPDAVKNLAAARKQVTNRKDDDVVKTEVLAVYAAVDKAYTAERDRLLAADPVIDTYEQLESLARHHEGLDTKSALDRLRELNKDKAMKQELAARDAWNKCQELLRSPKPSSQKSGKEGLALIAKTFPETKYGKLAAAPSAK